jgi:hypothetical protein
MAEPLNATFFTLKKRDRAVLLPATLMLIVLVAVIFGLYVAFNWAFFDNLIDMVRRGETAPMDEEAASAFGFGIMGLFFSAILFLIPFYLVMAAYEAACLRWMIRGEAPGLFGFAFNHDTWRVYGIYWCWLITQFAVSMVVSVVTLPIVFMMMGDIYAAGADPESPEIWSLQMRVQALSLLQYIPLAIIGLRLGPAAATSIARKRFSFFDAWVVTRDRFWALLGSYALLWIVLIVVCAGLLGAFWWHMAGQEIISIVQAPNADHSDTVRTIFERVWTAEGFALGGGVYAVYFAVSLVYVLLSYGINSRAALAALDEGKISVYQGDDD